MDIAEEYKKLWNYGGSSDEIFNHGRRYLVGVASPASHYLRTLPKLLAEESPALTRICVLYSGKGTFGWRVAHGVLESALGVARHSVHLVPINVPWDNHDTILSVLFGISPEIVALAGSFQDELALMQTRHRWPSTVREVAAVAAGVRAFSAELAQLADGVLGCVSFPCSLLSEAFSWFSPASRSSCECSCDLPSLKSLPCCFSSSRRWEDLLSFCVHGLRYPQHLMCSAGASRWYPSSRCASRGGLDRTGQHFARGEQGAAMPPDMVHGGVGTVRVEVTDGVLDQVNM